MNLTNRSFLLGAWVVGQILCSTAIAQEQNRPAQNEANLQVVHLKAVPLKMLFDKKEFTVVAGWPVEIVFENPDVMPEYNDDYEDRFIIPRLSKSIDPLDLSKALSVKDNFEEALNKLTDAQNFVLYLAYYEGKTQGEIANQLNIPVATVKSKIKVSLMNLKQNLVSGE